MNVNRMIQEVENGTRPLLKGKYKTTELFTVYKGKKQMYSHDSTMPGVTVYFKAHYGPETTIVYCDNLKRAYEIVEYQIENKVAIHDAQTKLSKYIQENKMY